MAQAGLTGSPRVLIYDLETGFNVLAAFALFGTDYHPHQNILQERTIICANWMWLGENKVNTVSVLDNQKRFKKNPVDDYHVVSKMREVMEEADIIVTHNGDSFDNKYMKARSIYHGFGPLAPFKSIDTKKIAKTGFMFNSNRLDYLGRFLGVGRKIETRPNLWLEALRGDVKAIKDMIHYGKGDVVLLRDVFLKMLPWMPEAVNRELYGGQANECPRPGCGSRNIQRRGLHRAISQVYQRWQCQACHGWFRTAKAEKRAPVTLRVL